MMPLRKNGKIRLSRLRTENENKSCLPYSNSSHPTRYESKIISRQSSFYYCCCLTLQNLQNVSQKSKVYRTMSDIVLRMSHLKDACINPHNDGRSRASTRRPGPSRRAPTAWTSPAAETGAETAGTAALDRISRTLHYHPKTSLHQCKTLSLTKFKTFALLSQDKTQLHEMSRVEP